MRHGLVRLAIVLAALAALEGVTRAGLVDEITLIPPSAMLAALVELLRSGRILGDLAFTLRNTALAVAIAVLGGFAIGVLLHAAPRLRGALAPFLEAYYAVPVFVFYPLLVGIFGLNAVPIVAIAAVFGIVAMVLNTLIGIDSIPPTYLLAARSYHMGAIATALMIKLPATAPHLLTGAKLAVAFSVIGIVAGEFILSTAGIGKLIAFAYNDFDGGKMYGLLLLLLTLVILVNGLLSAVERRIYRLWHRP